MMVHKTLLQVIHSANSPSVDLASTLPLQIDGHTVGLVRKSILHILQQHPTVFVISDKTVTFHSSLATPNERSDALRIVLQGWRQTYLKEFPGLKSWRNEEFPVFGKIRAGDDEWKKAIVLSIDRSAAGIFGIPSYGAHLNGYVIMDNGNANGVEANNELVSKKKAMKMWIARRAATKSWYPRHLDTLVGGGIANGSNPFHTIVKESFEEAGIPEELASTCTPTSFVSYLMHHPTQGIVPDTEFCFDLELPKEFQPTPQDGEVECFYLMSFEEIVECMKRNEFMPESALIIVDFMVRHGILTPADDADYVEIVSALRGSMSGSEYAIVGPDFSC